MSNNKWIGTALGLALCSAALTGCHFNDQQSGGEAAAPPRPNSMAPGLPDREQLRDAIAGAPANGLKPDLFLKGGEKGAGADPGGAQICLRAGQRLFRPEEAFRGLYDPATKRRREAGPSTGDPAGQRQKLARFPGAANRRISGAQPGGTPLSPARVQSSVPAGRRRQADQAGQPRSTGRPVIGALRAVGYVLRRRARPPRTPIRRSSSRR